jgi:DNA (cytosine-5)-methyltransferase 3A
MRPLPIGSSDCICCNDKGINVLSLFDGMSCGQLALDRLGIKVDVYLAAEIDKYAKQITKKNYPNTVHLGDVTKLRGMDLPKIDLLMGGSPCQGFSFAGKQLNFDDPRSALFFEFVRLLEETKPKYFLLENVRMKQEYQDVISEHLGVKPIMINSALMSAQNRVRFYWTNIPNVNQPEDKGIILKDVLEDLDGDRPCELFQRKRESLCHKVAIASDIRGLQSIKAIYGEAGKSPCLTTMGGGHREPKVLIKPIRVGNIKGGGQGDRVYSTDGKGISIAAQSGGTAGNGNMLIEQPPTYRKLTPMECERLQTVPDNYTEGVSNTQRYKMLGNGWTVDVIAHILSNIND